MASQNVVNDVDGGINDSLCGDKIRCMVLEREERRPEANNSCFPHGMVIDNACVKEWLEESVQSTRKNLPLNHKRPTVDRRFYCDTTREVICRPLEGIIHRALQQKSFGIDTDTTFIVYCNKYLRFLEYKTVGGELLPHRDGTKTCEDTGTKSTHTLLLFLSDCEVGGETLIMDDTAPTCASNGDNGNINWSKEKNLVLDVYEPRNETINAGKIFNKRRIRYTTKDSKENMVDSSEKASKTQIFRLRDATIRSIGSSSDGEEEETLQPPPRHVSVGIQPREGRILLFPHHWPHAGAMCKSVPKIALRAELTIARA